MIQAELYPPDSYVKVLTPIPQNSAVFGDKVFKEVMRSLEWALIQYDWCPYKRKFGHRHVCAQKGYPVKARGEAAIYLHARSRGIRQYPPCRCLELRLLHSRTVRNKFPCVSPPVRGTWLRSLSRLTHKVCTAVSATASRWAMKGQWVPGSCVLLSGVSLGSWK